MGFAEGFSAGSAAVSRGLEIKQRRIAEERQQKQQDLTALQAGYTQQDGQWVATDIKKQQENVEKSKLDLVEQELADAKNALKAQQSMTFANTIASMATNISDGNWEDTFKLWNNTPGLKEALRNAKSLDVNDLAPINFNDPNDIAILKEQYKLDTTNMTTEAQQAINSDLVRVQGHDGKWRIVPVDDIVKQTNSLAMMTKAQSELYTTQHQKNRAIIGGLRPEAADVNKAQLEAQQLTAEASVKYQEEMGAALKTGDMAKIQEVYDRYNPQPTKAKSASEEKAAFELNNMKEEKEIIDYVNNNQEQWSSILTRGDKTTKVDKSGKSLYSVAKTVQGDNKISSTRKDYLDGMTSTLDNTIRLKTKMENSDFNWDALNKAMDETSKVVDWRDLSTEEKQKMLDKFSFDSDLKTVMAGYIKAMSGAAVSDQERGFYEGAILGGTWANKESALAAMNGFVSGLKNGLDSAVSGLSSDTPATYLDYKTSVNKITEGLDLTNVSIPVADKPKEKPGFTERVTTNIKSLWGKATGNTPDPANY